MKIGFLFNHDQTHQVAHSLPIALELVRNHPDVEVVIATTNSKLSEEVRHFAAQAGMAAPLVQLGLKSGAIQMASRVLEPVLPLSKIGIYRDNLEFFRGLDALVVTEKTSLLLKTRYGLTDLKVIHTRHGAGDRAIGFNRASAGFDHVLVSGSKIRERLALDGGVPEGRMSIVGYPKFDLFPTAPALPFEDSGRPTVLYNPHSSPHLSSWYKHGRAVLEYFLHDGRYNLIFAPHVMLFHRPFVMSIDKLRVARPGRIDRRFQEAANIHIDLGSRASTDMTYTAAADIYLGDVSSQVYEFLYHPRPCLFLDSHGTDWRGDPNYAHWQAGEVLTDPQGLGRALDRAMASHDLYRPAQRALFERSFDLRAEPSARRAARAILGVLRPVEPTPLFGPRQSDGKPTSSGIAAA